MPLLHLSLSLHHVLVLSFGSSIYVNIGLLSRVSASLVSQGRCDAVLFGIKVGQRKVDIGALLLCLRHVDAAGLLLC